MGEPPRHLNCSHWAARRDRTGPTSACLQHVRGTQVATEGTNGIPAARAAIGPEYTRPHADHCSRPAECHGDLRGQIYSHRRAGPLGCTSTGSLLLWKMIGGREIARTECSSCDGRGSRSLSLNRAMANSSGIRPVGEIEKLHLSRRRYQLLQAQM